MPKAELHLHLDGSLRPATALELARDAVRRGLEGPDRAVVEAAARLPDASAMRARLVAPARCADQAELLRAFALPVALLRSADALERVAAELVEDVASDGTRYAEIRWAPSLHVRPDLPLRDGIAAVVRGMAEGSRRTGTAVRLIAVAMRTEPPGVAVEVVEAAAAFVPDGMAGFDLAGPEAAAPDPLPYATAVRLARERGLGVSCHAGEWGGAAQVWRTLELAPDRIAHGAPAADDPGLVRRLCEEGITLDLCPTSNVQAGVVPDLAAHPLARLARAGAPVTLSTDDRTVSDLTLVKEYANALDGIGLLGRELLGVVRHAFEAAFLHHDESLRRHLLAEHDTWVASHPAAPEADRRGPPTGPPGPGGGGGEPGGSA